MHNLKLRYIGSTKFGNFDKLKFYICKIDGICYVAFNYKHYLKSFFIIDISAFHNNRLLSLLFNDCLLYDCRRGVIKYDFERDIVFGVIKNTTELVRKYKLLYIELYV